MLSCWQGAPGPCALAPVLLCALGCPSVELPAPSCPIGAVLGDGSPSFAALADGSPASIVHGPQGGYHIEVSALVSGLRSPLRVDLDVIDAETGTEVSASRYQLATIGAPDDRCSALLPRMLAILDTTSLGAGSPDEVLGGREILATLRLVDARGVESGADALLVVSSGE